jgi:hypothetical protein
MQKVQNPWPLARPLEKALRDSPLSHVKLAEKAGVKYYAVRRMRLDGVTNRSKNAIALCKFFGISESAPTLSRADLESAVAGAWDGTEEHGRLILNLISCAEQYKVAHKS